MELIFVRHGLPVRQEVTEGTADPELDDRSLGARAILGQIDLANARGLDWLYLGYWIRDCRKMRYKIDYRPIEMFVNGVWVRVH